MKGKAGAMFDKRMLTKANSLLKKDRGGQLAHTCWNEITPENSFDAVTSRIFEPN
jgi:hypothetical protein